MKKKLVKSAKKSSVDKIIYLLKTTRTTETRVALVIGLLTGPLCPAATYLIFHQVIYITAGIPRALAVVVGLASGLISLINVSSYMEELTKSKVQGRAYAVLLEGLAMVLSGSDLITVFSLIALAVVCAVNGLKMAYNSLLKT